MTKDKVGILINGADESGGIDGIRSVKSSDINCRVIGLSRNITATGFCFCDKGYTLNYIETDQQFEKVLEIIKKENVRVILPISASETKYYARRKNLLLGLGVVFVGSSASVVSLCDEKDQFFSKISTTFPTPHRIEISNGEPAQYPCFVKPVNGSGSKNAGLCRSKSDWEYCSVLTEKLLVQEYLPGIEYSVDVLSSLTGSPLIAIPRQRLEIQNGITVKGQVVADLKIQQLCLKLAKYLKLCGPSCMQLKLRADGTPVFIEVNPRLGGSSVISGVAGFDMFIASVKLGLNLPIRSLNFREAMVARHYTQFAIS